MASSTPAWRMSSRHLTQCSSGQLLEVQVVEQAHDGPELRLLPIAQLPGEPAHHVLHRDGVAQVKGLLVVLRQQVPGLLLLSWT